VTENLEEIRNPRARGLLASIRGHGRGPSSARSASSKQHVRLFDLGNEAQVEEYLQLFCRHTERTIELLEDRSSFTSDKRYFTYVRWQEATPPKPTIDPKVAKSLRREKRTFFVRVFDLASEHDLADAVLNAEDVHIQTEKGQFFDDGTFLIALHWVKKDYVDTGEVTLDDEESAVTEEAPKKKKRRRRRRRRGHRGRGGSIIPREAFALAEAMGPSDDPLADMPGAPMS
jgi:hypothetical protein